MSYSSARTTAETGKTVLALVAILSLLLSLFAIVRPAIAFDDAEGPAVVPTVQPGNPSCPAGTTEIKFEGANLASGKSLSATIDGELVTVTITNVDVGGGSFDFEVDGGVAMVVIAKGGPNANVYDYRPGGAAHDDGLTTPINPNNNTPFGLSHISFCVVPIVAEIEVTKDGPELSKVGDPTDYTITVENTGNVELYIESVIDSLKGNLTAAVVAQCGPLAVDEVCTYSYSYTPVEGDDDPLLNTVDVTANSASDFTGAEATGSASASVNLFQPSIEVTKEADVETALVGDTITYTVTITNTSSSDSPDLVIDAISDTLVAGVGAECLGNLAPGASCDFEYTYTVQEGDPDPLENTVSVESNPEGFPNEIDGEATETVDLLVPSISVEKTGPDLSKVGDPTDYTVTITNTGDVELYIESVMDSLAGDLTAAVVAQCGSLAVAEICEYDYQYTPIEGDDDPLVNEVTVSTNTASDFSGTDATGDSSHTVELFQPSIEVTKEADVETALVGDTITYTVTITNTSSSDSPDLVIDAISDTLVAGVGAECLGNLAPGASCDFEYTYTVQEGDPDPLENTVSVESNPEGFPNEIDDEATETVDLVEEEVRGSITINKEVDCEECVTRTPGYWFNAAGSHDDETNALMAELAAADGGDASVVEVNIDGTVYEFATADDVRAFVDADISGDWDDEPGLSRDGALLRHYLSTWLNVALNGDECDLLSRMLGDQTVEEILDEAAAALEADDEDAEVAALEKLTAINESDDAEENPLTCDDSNGTSGDGFMFELFAEADFPDGEPTDSGTTGDDGPGTLVFSDLPLGTYVLVETGNDSERECEIVSVEGGVLNEDGTVTVEITEETPDVVLTIVNECEGGEEEPNPGDITVIKEAGDDADAEFAFSASWDGDGFVLTDGDSEFSGDLEAGEYTVTETLTPEQIAAGWTLTDIDCGDADVSVEGSTVTITLGEGDSVTCTFTNEQEEEENGLVEIDKLFCFTDEEASTTFFVFGPSPLPELDAFGQAEEEMPEDGCWTEAVSFTITGGDLEEPLEVMTDENGILEIELPASENAYVITEDLSGESAEFFVEDGAITTIAVLNLIPEDEAGLVKVIKLFCEAEGEPTVSFSVEGGDAPVPVISDCEVGDATFELGDLEITTEGGIAIQIVDAGEYTFAETDPNEATYDGTVVVEEGEITTIIVINTFEEGEQPGGGGPGGNETPREGTQGGNPLPNTATSPIPTGSAPAALLALLMLAGLGAASYAVRAEARRRR